ncbi:histidine kinase [Tenacibaculum larymnensis]|uniref:Histidine kinase n=1 Tax=Tenacibaculum larymnensis TaxID=2878201 RepID=A0A9X4IQ92_9FLAO|nr:sensor histidine kinase [Tenacibaculum larymnensis]MDE1206727.1 histidine kinase [Tenacibaculum larymnensis]
MNFRSWYNLLLICLLFLANSCTQKPVFKKHKTVFKVGDQQEWATKNWNDEDWKTGNPLIEDDRVFWLRTPIDILKAPELLHPYGIQLHVYGEYEVFWDGVLIGKNGNPGQEAVLGPEGNLWTTHSIPSHLTQQGEHLLAIRVSLHYFKNHAGIWEMNIDYYDDLLTDLLVETSYMYIFAGAFLIASIYFLFLFLGDKKEYATLIFSISCFLFFTLILAEFMKAYVPIHYSMHVTRLRIISFLMLSISFLIPLYFSMQFPFPRRKLLLTIYTLILLFFFLSRYVYELTANNMIFSMWFFSFGIVMFGVYKKMKGARLVMLTFLLSLPIAFIAPFNKSLFAGFSLILLGMFYLLSLRIKEQRLAYENSLVQSTRLRLELLKKNIQPHFLMNTLTSLIDWIEESPKKGVLFIEALANEFDIFNQIENKKLIPINQEIALCRSHLEIMEYRKEINYTWQEEGIDIEQKIPPGVFHTLLENGITHSLPLENNSIQFKLIFESKSDYKCYTFLTFATPVKREVNTKKEGTGIKYIKARLTESYQEQWEFTSEPVNHGWKNTIKIYS